MSLLVSKFQILKNILAVNRVLLALLHQMVAEGKTNGNELFATSIVLFIPLFVNSLSLSRTGNSQLDFACLIRIMFFILICQKNKNGILII
jgi:hypothetical protein